MKKRFYAVLAMIAFCMTLASCDSNKVYEEYVKIESDQIKGGEYIWDYTKPVSFEFEVNDTAALHNVYVNVRHANLYQYRNLWLFIDSWSPSGVKSVDTLECTLADDKGKWLGSGLGDIWDTQILWKRNVRFATPGKYHVEYKQGMRVDNLPGIMDMGLRVELADEE